MERLFASWRHAYVTRSSDADDCVFCHAQRSAEAGALIVHDGRTAFVILNLFPYNSGHLMVVPRRHVARLADLTRDELMEMAEAAADAGFADQSHMSRHFKRAYGMTPAHWVKLLAA